MAMMKKYSVALCGACALMMSSLVWSNDAAHGDAHKPEASKDAPAAATAAKADTSAAAKEIAQATKPARKKKGRAAKKAAQNAADAAPSAAAEQAKRIRVRQRGELASAVDAVQSGHASATEKHAADTHATTSNADHSQKTTTASVVSDGRASAVMEDRYMPVTKSVEAPAVEQSSYSLLDRHPAEYVKPAGEMASREAEPVASRAEPARVEAPAKIAVAETRPAVEPIAAAPASSPTPAAVAVREAMNNVQDSALACNPPLKSEVAALFDRWNASLRTGDPKKVVANYAPYSVLLPTVRARYSFSYKRVGNDWLISSHHSSGMPEQPPKVVVQAVEEKVVEKPAPKKVVERSENFQRPDGWVRFP